MTGFKSSNAERLIPINREQASNAQHRIRVTGEGEITLPLVHPELRLLLVFLLAPQAR